jgi:amphi-Trp domain-containing protein
MLELHERAMTEEPTDTANTTEAVDASEPEAEAEKDKSDEDDEGEDAEDEDEDEDEDEKKSKKKKKKKDKDKDKGDKPEKIKISFEASMPRNEAVSYFEAIVGGLRSGRLEFKQGDKTLILNPPDRLEIEVKAQSKGTKGSVVFEIEWSDENRPLEISN